MEWEYLLLHVIYGLHAGEVEVRLEGDTARVGINGLPAAMNALGREGWEAFSVVSETAQGAIKHVLFKRLVGNAEQPGQAY